MRAFTYAKGKGLIPQTFLKWTKMGKKSRQNFIEITSEAIQPGKSIRDILIEKGGVKIHIPLGMSSNELREVIEGLGIAI